VKDSGCSLAFPMCHLSGTLFVTHIHPLRNLCAWDLSNPEQDPI
jgi:hypothetical protein